MAEKERLEASSPERARWTLDADAEDFYPLSPTQSGLLFHSLYAPETGLYFEQHCSTIEGALDTKAFVQAWREVAARNVVLRTAFVWEGLDEPLQVVKRRVEIPWQMLDWRDVSESERPLRIASFLRADRAKGFDLHTAPLTRMALLRLGEREWQLIWSHHHLILDGASLSMVLDEVMALYDRVTAGGLPLPEEPRRPYRDYIEWLSAQDRKASEGFWRETLSGIQAPTALPLPRPASSSRAAADGGEPVPLSSDLAASLEHISLAGRFSLETVLQGAFGILLRWYSGDQDVVFGTIVSGRSAALPGIDRMVGLFVNAVPLRVRMSGADTLAAVFDRIRDARRALAPFEQTSVLDIRRWSDLGREMPLFENLVVFENEAAERAGGDAGSRVRLREAALHERTKYPLTFRTTAGSNLRVQLLWEEARFESSAIRRMAVHLARILETAAADPDRRLADLGGLSAGERQQLAFEWSSVDDPAVESGLHHRFEQQAASAPDAVALVEEGEQLTYGLLNRRANQLAHHLCSVGIGCESKVAICQEREAELLVSILGVLKAGAAYVPLDPSYPRERLELILRDSGASALLTRHRLRERLPAEHAATLIDLDAERGKVFRGEGLDPMAPANADQLAYVIYTSGSTGTPKGVEITHRNVMRLFRATDENFHFGPGDVWALFHSYAFDFSVWEIFGALLYGGRLVVVPYLTSRSPELFDELLRRERVTVLNQTPSAFRSLVSLSSAAPPEDLRWVIFGGEALDFTLVESWLRSEGTRPRLVNMYGITETTVHVTHRLLGPGDGSAVSGSRIGAAISDLSIWLLDQDGSLAPIAVPGEIHVGGAGLARGYCGRPQTTAEKFVPHPAPPAPGDRLYRAGDWARYWPDRDLEYLGRKDHQVKIRGFRIELGEIEKALAQHPAVSQCAVLVRDDALRERRIVGYVVTDGSAVTEGELRAHLQRKLPGHMVPAVFAFVDRLPLTPSGKLDPRALPPPEGARRPVEDDYVAPRNETEAALSLIWQEVLGLDRVGVHDNFFALGGDSILSIQVVARSGARGLKLTPRQIFQFPTVSALAEVVGQAPRVSAEQHPVAGPVELTPIQRWYLEIDPEPRHFNQAFLLDLTHRLDPSLLRETLAELIGHHDALRLRLQRQTSSFTLENLTPEEARVRGIFVQVDLLALPAVHQGSAVEEVTTRLQESLLPSEAPLIRAACFELTASSQRLFLAAHHLAVDGLSWRILLEDMFSAYEQRWRGRPIVLPPKTTSFQAWSKRIHQHATSESLAAEASYWREILASPSGRLPLDRSDGENLSGSAETVAVSLSREETDALLHSVSSAYRTQINDLLLCALGQELTAWCQSDAVLVDLESHGREDLFEDVDVSRTVGWFTSIFPFRLAPGGGGPPGAALKRVKEDLRRVPRGGIGFGLLRYLRGGAEGAALATARPEVSFNYLGQLDAFLAGQVPVRFAPESIGPPRNPESLRSHLLEINGAVRDGELQFAWTYSRNRHAPATIEKRASSFLAFLRALIEHCLQPDSGGATPSDFPLARLDSAELDEIVGTAREVEDLYGLAPLQQGILVHSIGTPGSGPYFQQFCWGIEGNVESELMRRAWERLVQRHAILRTAFVWEGLGRPVQIVYRTARLPWQYQDWRGDSAREQSDRLRQFLDTDRGRGFDLTRPPLLRVALLRLAENRWYLAWSHHHLILDAWSVDILWKELIHSYEALRRNQDIRLERARPYGDFIGWLERRDLAVAEVFWRRTLTGLKRPTRLPLERPGNVGGVEADGYRRESATLPQPDAAALQQLARRESVEIDTLAPAAFAVLLNRYTNEIDVVFGAAVDGRSNPVPGIQSMLGVLMNTLCLRLQPRPERRTVGWLRESQQHFDAALAHEHTSLSLQERWSEVPAVSGGRPLFESVVVVENRPIDPSRHSIAGRFSLSQVFRRRQTSFPLTLYVAPAQGFTLEIVYDVRRYEAAAMTRMLGHLSCLLASIAAAGAAAGESSLSELSMLTPVERKQVLAEIGAGKERSVEGRDLDVQLLDGLLDPVSIGVPGEIPGGAEAGSFQYAAPRSETEQELSRIWALALGVDRVGIFDDFFALGGDSVAAIRAASLARHAGFLLTPVQLFENPTIAGLSAAGTTVLETPSAERAVEAPGSLPILPDPPDVPSPIANVDGEMLRPLSKDGEIEDLYRLSPMQAGILFHSLYAPHSSAYFDQHSCTLEGPFDARAFRDAWMRSVERHPILRTCFTWEGLAEPMQIVRPKVELPWVEHDWRNLPSDLRSERLSSLLRADRMHGFDLTRAPLMRLTLIRLSETSFYLLWSHHHLLLDGWSVPLLLTEVMLTYESLLRGQPIALGPAAPFRSYIDWLRVQDLSEAEAFWRRSLSGFIETTPLKIGEVSQGALGDGEAHGEAEILLSPESTAALEAFSRRERMTANTVIQGAWGLLLSRYSGREDVLFGATVSGRSAPIPGVETAVGLFINAVPIRLRVRPTSRLSAWLKEIQERQSEAREYEHAPLAEVQSWSDLPQGAPLFESLLAFENFPLDRTLSERGGSLRIRDVQVYDRTNYPLTLIIIPGPQLLLRANYDRQRFADSSMRRLVGRLSRLIENMVGRREALLEELQIDTEAEIGSAPPILSGRAGGSELSGSSSAG